MTDTRTHPRTNPLTHPTTHERPHYFMPSNAEHCERIKRNLYNLYAFNWHKLRITIYTIFIYTIINKTLYINIHNLYIFRFLVNHHGIFFRLRRSISYIQSAPQDQNNAHAFISIPTSYLKDCLKNGRNRMT